MDPGPSVLSPEAMELAYRPRRRRPSVNFGAKTLFFWQRHRLHKFAGLFAARGDSPAAGNQVICAWRTTGADSWLTKVEGEPDLGGGGLGAGRSVPPPSQTEQGGELELGGRGGSTSVPLL